MKYLSKEMRLNSSGDLSFERNKSNANHRIGNPYYWLSSNGCFLGLCFVISCSTSTSLFAGQFIEETISQQFSWLSSSTRIGFFVAMALLSSRIGKLSAHKRVLWIATILMVAGDAAALLAPLAGSSEPFSALRAIGILAMNMGYAVLYMFWIELYSRMSPLHVIACFSLVHLC
jgi:MFS family permease